MNDILTSKLIHDAIHSGWTIVAATERLARDLRVRYSLTMRAEGRQGWLAPDIPAFRDWVTSAWTSTWPDQQILHGAQELSLWLYAVEGSHAGESILNKTAAARAARAADRIAAQWRIDRNGQSPDTYEGEDETAYREWSQKVASTAASRGWTTDAEIPALLTAQLIQGNWIPPTKILFTGFTDINRSQSELFSALEQQGVQVRYEVILEPREGEVTLHRPHTRAEQYRIVAGKLRDSLLAIKDASDTPRIGILVPDPNEARALIEPVLREFLAPQSAVPGPHAGQRPWRYARGIALSEQALVSAALDVISIQGGITDLQTLSRVTLSPWLFPTASSSERAELDLALRKAGGTRFSHKRVVGIAARLTDRTGNAFAARFAMWIDRINHIPPAELPSAWSARWTKILTDADWATEQEQNPDIRTARDAWTEALNAFQSMDSQVREINHARALVWLREVLSERPVQASVEHLQPVYILGYEDCAGMVFDYLAVCDANSNALPAAPVVLGFIPQSTLQASGFSRATPEGTLKLGKQWVDNIRQQADQIDVFAPRFDERGAHLDPSLLFGPWTTSDDSVEKIHSQTEIILKQGVQAVLPGQDPVGAVGDPVTEGVLGGTRIITDMSASPFIAFAHSRLGMSEFPNSMDGLDPQTQGKTIHRVLELIWKQLKDSATLAATSDADLDQLIKSCVSQACEAEDRISENRYGKGLAQAEQERIISMTTRWMAMERARDLPFEVLHLEVRSSAMLAGLKLGLQIDRIDRVFADTPRILVIDYKTGGGDLKVSAWDTETLSEPQLPIYAACADLSEQEILAVDGIAFGHINNDTNKFLMVSNFASRLVPNTKGTGTGDSSWEYRVTGWRSACEELAKQFMQGNISIDRKSFNKTILKKGLEPLARTAPPTPAVDTNAPEAPF